MKTIHRAQINMVIAEIRMRRRYRLLVQAVQWLRWTVVYELAIVHEFVNRLNWLLLAALIFCFVMWGVGVAFLRTWLYKEFGL